MIGQKLYEELRSEDTHCKLLTNEQTDERTSNKLPKFYLSLSIISQDIERKSFSLINQGL